MFEFKLSDCVAVENLSNLGAEAAPGDYLRVVAGDLCLSGRFYGRDQSLEVSSWRRCCLPRRGKTR